MSRSPAKSGKAIAMKSLKEKWLSIVQSAREKGENEIGGPSTITGSSSNIHFVECYKCLCLVVIGFSIYGEIGLHG